MPLNPQGEWMPTFAADLPPSATAVADVAPQTAPAIATDELDWDLDAPLFEDLAQPPVLEISAPAPAPAAVAQTATIERPSPSRPVQRPAAATVEREPASAVPRRAGRRGVGRRGVGRRGVVAGVCVLVAVAAVAATHHGAAQAPTPAASPVIVDGAAGELTRAVSAARDRGEVLAREAERMHRRRVAAERRARARKAAAARRARERRKRVRAAAAAPRVVVRPQVSVAPPAPAAAAAPASPATPAHKSFGQSSGSAADQEFGL